MWRTLRTSPEANPGFISSMAELLQSTSRNIVLALGGVYLKR